MTSHSLSFTLLQKETTIVGLPAIDFPQLIPNDRAPSFIIICCALFSLPSNSSLERFSIECRKTKTKVITPANTTYTQTITKDIGNPVNQSKQSKYKRGKTYAGRLWLWLASHWLKMWREFFKPIAKRRNAKTIQMRIIFDTRVKTLSIRILVLVSVVKR